MVAIDGCDPELAVNLLNGLPFRVACPGSGFLATGAALHEGDDDFPLGFALDGGIGLELVG